MAEDTYFCVVLHISTTTRRLHNTHPTNTHKITDIYKQTLKSTDHGESVCVLVNVCVCFRDVTGK